MESQVAEVQPSQSEMMEREKERNLQLQKVWLSRIEKEEKVHAPMRKRAREVQQVFNSNLPDDPLYVPLYWMVCNVQHVGIYSSQPVPDVRPRNEYANPVFSDISRVIHRGIKYFVDHKSFDFNFHRAIDDYLSVSLGVVRIKLDSEIKQAPVPGSMNMMGQPQFEEQIGEQRMRWEYVSWNCFGWMPCNSWEAVNWVYFKHPMTQAECQKKFGRTVRGTKQTKHSERNESWLQNTVDIYEIWDKVSRKVLFVAKGEQEPIQVVDDPLELEGFFPMPDPMMHNIPSDELIPKPDYNYIEEYDKELNDLQERRKNLLKQIKSTGAYEKGLPELAGIMDLDDGQLLAVQNLAGRMASAGGQDAAIFWMPIKEKVEALVQLTMQIQVVKAQVDEILGISDIVMGTTKASETATAQEIKGRWVGVRLTRKRELVQYTVREMFRIMAQLLVSHITPENLQRMTQIQLTQEMSQLMQNDTMMDFIIDVETQSTVAKDEDSERRTHQEMLNGVAQFSQAVLPMVAQNIMPADVANAILTCAMQPYSRYSRALDEALRKMPNTQMQLQKLGQQLQQTQQQLQQVGQQMQQWRTVAEKLQMEATQAKTMKLAAEASKIGAETVKTQAETRNEVIEPLKTAAETGKLEAETQAIKRGQSQNGQFRPSTK